MSRMELFQFGAYLRGFETLGMKSTAAATCGLELTYEDLKHVLQRVLGQGDPVWSLPTRI